MITLDDIKSQWAEDSKIDNDLLDNESTKIPQLHSKYLNYLTDVRLIKLRKEQEYKVLVREKFEYYTGKADDKVYQEKGYTPEVVAGTATAGIPHAAWLSNLLDLPMVYVRGQAKQHGKESRIEGKLAPGQKVVLIEDLISTGTSLP